CRLAPFDPLRFNAVMAVYVYASQNYPIVVRAVLQIILQCHLRWRIAAMHPGPKMRPQRQHRYQEDNCQQSSYYINYQCQGCSSLGTWRRRDGCGCVTHTKPDYT